MPLFRTYYYGPQRWENYLLDVKYSIENQTQAQTQSSEKVRSALAESNRSRAEQLRQLQSTLENGFESLGAIFETGLGLIADRLDTQIDILSGIAARLDAIHNTLKSPLMTQARELFEMGQDFCRRELLDKALDAFLKAEQKNEVDFPLQFQIGILYLSGCDNDDNVIDLPKAESHLLLAARYADSERATLPTWNVFCGKSYFYAAQAAYLIGQEKGNAGDTAGQSECLARALNHLSRAASLWPEFAEIRYMQAKCHALLGHSQDVLQIFEALSDWDRRYCAKSSEDGDFNNLHEEIQGVFRRALASPGPRALDALVLIHETEVAATWAKRSEPQSPEDIDFIRESQTGLEAAKLSLPTLDVDIEGLGRHVFQWKRKMVTIANNAIKVNTAKSQQAIDGNRSRKSANEYRITTIEREMKQTSGGWGGCLTAFIFYFILFTVLRVLEPVLIRVLPRTIVYGSSLPLMTGVLIAVVLAGIWGAALTRRIKNQAKVQQRRECLDDIAACEKELPGLEDRVDKWKRLQVAFEEWRSQ